MDDIKDFKDCQTPCISGARSWDSQEEWNGDCSAALFPGFRWCSLALLDLYTISEPCNPIFRVRYSGRWNIGRARV